jgi:ABC-type dipeptide/oligopeptide/nickel transport system permease component
VITETVFAWPGVGSLSITAINQRDYPVVQAVVLVLAVLVVLVNWLVDVTYHIFDPRVR